jgi:DNA-binding transcriptional regulator GbsR (MarR family)
MGVSFSACIGHAGRKAIPYHKKRRAFFVDYKDYWNLKTSLYQPCNCAHIKRTVFYYTRVKHKKASRTITGAGDHRKTKAVKMRP